MSIIVASDRPAELSTPARLALLAAFAAVVLGRLPQVALHPRFFEEEGPYFFAYAWHMPAWAALWHTLGGYLNLPANAATLAAASLVRAGGLPLEAAPVLTETIAFAFQLVPAILLLWGRADWLQPRWAAPLALLFVAMAPASEEVWLHTLHIQFHLALAVAIMLATEPAAGGPMRVFRLALLTLAPLAGPPAVALLPLYIARAILDRTRNRTAELAALALGAVLQLALFAGGSASRAVTITPALFANVVLARQIVEPLAGWPFGLAAGRTFRALYDAGDWRFLATAAGVAVGAAALALAALRHPRHGASWLFASAVLAAGAAYVGGLGPAPQFLHYLFAERYSFLPNSLLPVAAVAALATASGAWARVLAVLVGWWGLVSVFNYQYPFAGIANGPDWRAEVEAYRLDPTHRLRSWPEGRTVNLSPGALPCRPDDAEPSDFCPRHWELNDAHPRPGG